MIVSWSLNELVAENEMNGMTPKELEKEKMQMGRMGFDLKAKRQVSGKRMNHEMFG